MHRWSVPRVHTSGIFCIIPKKTVDGVMVLNLDGALYLYQVSRKYLKGLQSYWADAICILKFAKGHYTVKV